ncbi:MAG: ECF transporter S component [Clostridiales bacterium]|nr:ECF transporter S component [Clostridiales bacterium]
MKISRTKQLTTLAIFAAISIILAYLIHFPIFPQAAYLEYDPADVTILIASFIFGPMWGLGLIFCVAAIQAMTVSVSSGIIGFFMHFIATGAFCIAAGMIYKYKKNTKSAVIGLLIGVISMTAIMIPLNLIFTPMYGVPLEAVKQMMIPVTIPFNLVKAGINAILAFLLYKKIEKIINPTGRI